eukprot:gene22338-26947_t
MKTPIFILEEPQDRFSTANIKKRDIKKRDDNDDDGDDVGEEENGEKKGARRARDMQLIHVSRCCEWVCDILFGRADNECRVVIEDDILRLDECISYPVELFNSRERALWDEVHADPSLYFRQTSTITHQITAFDSEHTPRNYERCRCNRAIRRCLHKSAFFMQFVVLFLYVKVSDRCRFTTGYRTLVMAIQMNAARRDVTATMACDGKTSKNSRTSEEQHRRLFPDDTRLGRRSIENGALASEVSHSCGGLLSDTGRKVQHLLDSLFFYWFDFDDGTASVDARDETDAILHQLFNSTPTDTASAIMHTNANEGVIMTISNLMLHVITTSSATSLKAGDRSSGSSGSSCPFSPSSSSKPVAYVRDTLLGMYVWGCGFDRTLADAIYAIMGYKSFAHRWDGTSLPYIAPSNYWNTRERNSANRHWRGWRDDIKAAFSERRDRCRRYTRSYNFGLEIVSRFIQVTHLLWSHPEHHDVPLQFWLHYWKHRDDPIVVKEMRFALDSHRAHLGHICTHLTAAAKFESPPTDLVESIMKEIMHVAIVCRRRPEYADLATDGLCAIFESRPLRWYHSRNCEAGGGAATECMHTDEIADCDEFNSNTLERFHAVIDAMRRSGHLKEARELFRRIEKSGETDTDQYDWSERCGNVVGPYA